MRQRLPVEIVRLTSVFRDLALQLPVIHTPERMRDRVLNEDRAMESQSSGHPFVSKFTEPQRAQLVAMADEVTFEKDEIVLASGERSTHLYLIVGGSVGVDVVARYYTARIQTIGPGGIFGWSSLLDGCDTFFQIRAREGCSALRLDGARLRALCRENPALGVELLSGVLRTVADRVLAAEAKLAEFCGVSTRGNPPAYS
jgi:CRP-like cAMP-binding protein